MRTLTALHSTPLR